MALNTSRRRFLRSAALTSAGFLGLRGHVCGSLLAQRADLYGPLRPDPDKILDLPEGFSYTIVARSGETMDDGLERPGSPDGMAAFDGPGGSVVLVCNHELDRKALARSAFGGDLKRIGQIPAGKVYGFGEDGDLCFGGTTTIVYDPRSRTRARQFLSLAGTDRNCAGGPTPWGSWLTCEESTDLVGGAGPLRHGFVFEVPAAADGGLVDPVPLKDMGRFRHEAVAVDPRSGIVYETEDQGEGLIYRFIPNRAGNLAEGGRLQALALAGQPGADTRNWTVGGADPIPVARPLPVRWVDIADSQSPQDDMRFIVRERGGAACFARGEGMWFGRDEVFFACTNGGASKNGQIFRYRPSPHEGTNREDESPGTLELFLESDRTNLLEMCDNLTVAPWGDLVICEDGSGTDHLRGVAADGLVYNLARNAATDSELCGACFAPHLPILFVNIQQPGLTLAITGPWERRNLPA